MSLLHFVIPLFTKVTNNFLNKYINTYSFFFLLDFSMPCVQESLFSLLLYMVSLGDSIHIHGFQGYSHTKDIQGFVFFELPN